MNVDESELRAVVREVLAELGWREGGRREDGTSRQPGTTPGEGGSEGSVRGWSGTEDGAGAWQGLPAQPGLQQRAGGGYSVHEDVRAVETVSLRTDADLAAFVMRLLHLFENPARRDGLRAGRIRFRLAPGVAAGSVRPARRVDKGAVTEAMVAAASREGARLVLGRRAVLTPLARDRARACGVEIERER